MIKKKKEIERQISIQRQIKAIEIRAEVALLAGIRKRELAYFRRWAKRANTTAYRENSNGETSFRASGTFFYRRYTGAVGCCVESPCENRVLCSLAAASSSADNETYCRRQAGVTTANPIHALSTRYLIAYYVDADTQERRHVLDEAPALTQSKNKGARDEV